MSVNNDSKADPLDKNKNKKQKLTKNGNLDNKSRTSKISSMASRESNCCNQGFGAIFREFFCGDKFGKGDKSKQPKRKDDFDNDSLLNS